MPTTERERERGKRLWKDRKEWGLCAKCGKHKPAEGRARCESCLRKMSDLKQKRRMAGLCTDCGKPAYNGYTRCYEHYIKYKLARARYQKHADDKKENVQ